MKKIIYIITFGALVALSGCKKFLGLNPQSTVPDDQFYQSIYDVNAAVAGMYSGFQQMMIGEANYKERILFWGDYRSDNFDRFISYTNTNTTEFALNGLTNDDEFTDWTVLYNVIGRANKNIKHIPDAAKMDSKVTQAVIDKANAECYAVRAMCYFYLIRVWGDAPIWTEPMEKLSMDLEKPRSPVDTILNKVIIPDLTNAYNLLVKNQTPNIYTVSEASVCANLADVYMWKKDYPNAILWMNNLFKAKNALGTAYGNTGATLQQQATWKTIFTAPNTSTETIWSIHWDFVANGCACMNQSWSPNNKTIIMDSALYRSWVYPQTNTSTATGDIRPKQTLDAYTVSDPTKNNRDRFIKFYASSINPTKVPTAAELAVYYTQQLPVYMPVYRLSDIYLLYAEALNATSDLANALKYLNYVHVRAGLPAYIATNAAVANQAAMADAILQERQWELIGEGKRWFDLIRTNNVVRFMDPVIKRRQISGGTPAASASGLSDTRKILFPLNRTVLNSNKKLVQNPGYGG
jgi:tetratricopeptide (TPR) repeat protein